MTGAVVLALPGLLCAVMAWDLSQTGPMGPQQRITATVLAACAGSCLAAALLTAVDASARAELGVVLGSGALGLVTVAHRGRRGRRDRRSPSVPTLCPGTLPIKEPA